MLEIRNLCAGYPGRDVLKNISFTAPAGSITIILGPNGCGKSTLLRAAMGLLPRQQGEILMDSVSIDTLTAGQVAKKIAYLPQFRAVPNITAGRMVLHGRFPHLGYPRRYRAEDYRIARQAMEEVDAVELKDRYLPKLSGGQRQKVYLAMALAQEADVIFMDEPTTYLDVLHQLELLAMTRRLADQGKAVILVLHDVSLAMQWADQLVVLDDGQIAKCGTPEEIFESAVLEKVMRIRLRRMQTESGWRYYCTLQ